MTKINREDAMTEGNATNPLPSSPSRLPIGPMTERWILDNAVSQDLKDQWIKNGFSILRGAYSKREIDAYNRVVAAERLDLDDGKDEHGFGDRIGHLHQKYPELLKLAANRKVLSFLRWAFDDEPIVFGSLNFERGTTQEAHIDAIFFWPEPSYSMAGCWVALEDIHPDSGPLFYVPKSHTWPFYRSEDVVRTRPDLAQLREQAPDLPPDQRAKIVSELGLAWTEDFRGLERQYKTERPPLSLKAGDVVFWHSLLAHGGSPRVNTKLSRRSVVFHFVGKKTKLYTFEQFMLFDREKIHSQPAQSFNLRSYNRCVEYIRYPYFVTYSNGREKVHDLGPDVAAPVKPTNWLRRLVNR